VEPRRLPILTGGKIGKLRGEGIYNRAVRDGGRRPGYLYPFPQPITLHGVTSRLISSPWDLQPILRAVFGFSPPIMLSPLTLQA
jgi:hypothetical protein